MCPPGGSSFTMAWSMACTMRRKRQVTYKNSFREILILPSIHNYLSQTTSSVLAHRFQICVILAKRALIAPSIHQLQIICCDVGCSVNDLMSYCGQLTGW
ncbi:unnamed protein product [Angiostrongylus costaricensis]|uniref:Secreted protein n=1 Tax=Angiostrongylus costaricensis TaxID=334426 RepID=A0A0R3PF49_ANGCS|nr:unnamed protein product [Angiostrongylus costaricensis]